MFDTGSPHPGPGGLGGRGCEAAAQVRNLSRNPTQLLCCTHSACSRSALNCVPGRQSGGARQIPACRRLSLRHAGHRQPFCRNAVAHHHMRAGIQGLMGPTAASEMVLAECLSRCPCSAPNIDPKLKLYGLLYSTDTGVQCPI